MPEHMYNTNIVKLFVRDYRMPTECVWVCLIIVSTKIKSAEKLCCNVSTSTAWPIWHASRSGSRFYIQNRCHTRYAAIGCPCSWSVVMLYDRTSGSARANQVQATATFVKYALFVQRNPTTRRECILLLLLLWSIHVNGKMTKKVRVWGE